MLNKNEFGWTVNLTIGNSQTDQKTEVPFLIDTGFSAVGQINSTIAKELALPVVNSTVTTGFDGQSKTLDVVNAIVHYSSSTFIDVPMQVSDGPSLLGVQFFQGTQQMLIVDFRHDKIVLTNDQKVQKKVHKTVEKYRK